jgi:hypothetical protein
MLFPYFKWPAAARLLLPIAIAAFAYGPPANAELRVLESNSPNYPVGTVLKDESEIKELGKGCNVRVLRLDSNTTQLFSGQPKHQLQTGATRGPRHVPAPCE